MRTLNSACVSVLLLAAVPAAQDAGVRNAGTRNAVVGRVTTPEGKPVAGAVVTLLERSTNGAEPAVHFVSVQLHVSTDADGRYMIPQVRIGEFFVLAIPHNAPLAAEGGPNRAGYGRTFFPSARTIDAAVPVMVNVREAVTANITLTPAALAVVSGTVFDSNGSPVPNAQLNISHGDHLFGMDSFAARVTASGRFALPGIPPGTYFLRFHESAWPPARGEVPILSSATVVVNGEDVRDVRVVPIHPVHAEGRVIIDPSLHAQLPPDFEVVATPIEGNPGPTPPHHVNADLTFAFDAWPGLSRVRALPLAAGLQIRRVTWHGVDVTDTGIDFKDGQPVTGIEVELGRR